MDSPSFELTNRDLIELLAALIQAELSHLRPETSPILADLDWSMLTPLGQHASSPGLALDSIERFALCSRIADFFQLQSSGLEDRLLIGKTLGDWVTLILASRAQGSRSLGFSTSGSTGQPKLCIHTWPSLVDEALFLRTQLTSRLETESPRFLALAPCHHIYGFLLTLLVPALGSSQVIRGHRAYSLARSRQLQAGDILLGHPLIWNHLNNGTSFPDGVIGVTSTGPCDPALIQALLSQGLGCMFEIYGATETAGIGLRTHPAQPYQLMPRWQAGEDSLTDQNTQQVYPLMDTLDWLDSKHFHPQGRKDRVVQVGGVNVSLSHLEAQLERLDWVDRARVRKMQPQQEGERLKAFIVPKTSDLSVEQMRQQLTDWCERNLTAPQRPKHFTFGSALPVNAMGKAQDWPIR